MPYSVKKRRRKSKKKLQKRAQQGDQVASILGSDAEALQCSVVGQSSRDPCHQEPLATSLPVDKDINSTLKNLDGQLHQDDEDQMTNSSKNLTKNQRRKLKKKMPKPEQSQRSTTAKTPMVTCTEDGPPVSIVNSTESSTAPTDSKRVDKFDNESLNASQPSKFVSRLKAPVDEIEGEYSQAEQDNSQSSETHVQVEMSSKRSSDAENQAKVSDMSSGGGASSNLQSPPFVRHRLKPRGSDPHLLSTYCKNGNVANDEYLYTRPPHHYLTYRRKFPNEFKTACPGETFLLPFTTYLISDDENSDSENENMENVFKDDVARLNSDSSGQESMVPKKSQTTDHKGQDSLQHSLTQPLCVNPPNSVADSQSGFDNKGTLTTVMTVKGPIELK